MDTWTEVETGEFPEYKTVYILFMETFPTFKVEQNLDMKRAASLVFY